MGGGKGQKKTSFLLFYSLVPLWVPLAAFLLNFGFPGHHFGTFFAPFWEPWVSFWHPWAPPQWWPQSNEDEVQTNLAGFIFVEFQFPGYDFGTLGPAHTVIRSCVHCIMQHSTSSTSREPRIQWKCIIKATWLRSFLLNFEVPGYHFVAHRSRNTRKPKMQWK